MAMKVWEILPEELDILKMALYGSQSESIMGGFRRQGISGGLCNSSTKYRAMWE